MTWFLLSPALLTPSSAEAYTRIMFQKSPLMITLPLLLNGQRIFKQQLKNGAENVQQYRDLITVFEEMKHIYYLNVYWQDYSDGRSCRKP